MASFPRSLYFQRSFLRRLAALGVGWELRAAARLGRRADQGAARVHVTAAGAGRRGLVVHHVLVVLGRQRLVLIEVPALGQRHVLRADTNLLAVVAVADGGGLLVLQGAGVDAFATAAGGLLHHGDRALGQRRRHAHGLRRRAGGRGGGHGLLGAAARLDGARCAGHVVSGGSGGVLGHCVGWRVSVKVEGD